MSTVINVAFPAVHGNAGGMPVKLLVNVRDNEGGGIHATRPEFAAAIDRINAALGLKRWMTFIHTVPDVFIIGQSYQLALVIAYLLARGHTVAYRHKLLIVDDYARRRYNMARKIKLSFISSMIRACRKAVPRYKIIRGNNFNIVATGVVAFDKVFQIGQVQQFQQKVELLIREAKTIPLNSAATVGSVFFYPMAHDAEPSLQVLKRYGVVCVPVDTLYDAVRIPIILRFINIMRGRLGFIIWLTHIVATSITKLFVRAGDLIRSAKPSLEAAIFPAKLLTRFGALVARWLARPIAVTISLFISYVIIYTTYDYFFPACDPGALGWRVMQQASLMTLVRSADISKCNTYLASGDQDGVLRIWNLRTGELIRSHTGHDGPIEKVAFSVDDGVRVFGFRMFGGPALYSVGADGFVRSWDVRTGELTGSLRQAGRPTAVAVSSDRRMIALASSDAPDHDCQGPHIVKFYRTFYDRQGRRRLRALRQTIESEDSGSGCADQLELSCDGTLVALAHQGKEIRVWESATGNYVRTIEEIEQAPRFRFRCGEGYKDRLVTTGQFTGQDRLTTYDVSTGLPKQSYGYGGDVFDAMYETPQGEMIVAGVDGAGDQVILDLPKGTRFTVFGAELEPRVLGFSRDGSIMVSTLHGRRLMLVDTKTRRRIP